MARNIIVAPMLNAAEGRRHKSHTALITAAISQFCFISDLCPWKSLDRGESQIIFITEEVQISPSSSLFSTLKCLVRLRKKMNISIEKAKLGWQFSITSFSHPMRRSRFHSLSPLSWLLGVYLYPVLTSGCSSDLKKSHRSGLCTVRLKSSLCHYEMVTPLSVVCWRN